MPKRRPSGDGMVRKRTDGRWEGRIVVGHKSDGRPIFRSAFGKSQREVMQKLHQLIDVYRGAELDENSRLTLGEWLDRWLDVKGETLRVGTMNKYRHYVESYIKKYIGEKKVSSLSTTEVQKFYNKIKSEGRVRETREHGKEMSDSMVRSIHMMLHEALEDAVREHLAVKNATDGTTVPRQHHKPLRVLGDSGLEKFIASLDGDAWHDFFYTATTRPSRETRAWSLILRHTTARNACPARAVSRESVRTRGRENIRRAHPKASARYTPSTLRPKKNARNSSPK